MLSFAAYSEGKLADTVNLSGAYLIGSDDIPLRADITFAKGIISCNKRAAGPAGLALLWEVPGVGSILLETIRVQEREKPYVLQVELARGRLMRLLNKLEDWGLLDHADLSEVLSQVDEVRGLVIQALQADTAVFGTDDGITFFFQDSPHHLLRGLVVLDHQNAPRPFLRTAPFEKPQQFFLINRLGKVPRSAK